jgi:hypothetical protein
MGKNDFLKLVCFVKGALISAEVISKSKAKLTHEAKYHFNQVYNSCRLFEKFVHQLVGKDQSEMEDEVNSLLIGIVWSIYEMDNDEREAFISHMEKFNYTKDASNSTI